jgi:hypothetical protein
MSVDVFRQALRSLPGWPGYPRRVRRESDTCTLKFADLMAVLVEEVPDQRQRGLWTNNLGSMARSSATSSTRTVGST